MPEKSPAELVEWYDKLAEGYDELYAEEQSLKYDAVLKAVGPRRFETVIDLACGTGLFLERLRLICDFVVGVDVSRAMLLKARERFRKAGFPLIRADCSALPLRDGISDGVFSISLLEPGHSNTRKLEEMRRISAPSGVLVGTMFRAGTNQRSMPSKGLDGEIVWLDLSSREVLFLMHRAML